jgi:hypothetical protein
LTSSSLVSSVVSSVSTNIPIINKPGSIFDYQSDHFKKFVKRVSSFPLETSGVFWQIAVDQVLTTLETSGKDGKLHSKRVEKIDFRVMMFFQFP